MQTKLQEYFPMIKTRQTILDEINRNSKLCNIFERWEKNQQEEFLDFCTGVKGVKLLYDAFFKQIMNPETAPKRLEEFISAAIGEKVKILHVLPNESARIAAEDSLLIMDMVVQLADGSLANVEVQKLGYRFSDQRSACYSSDLLLRQYKRLREEKGKNFTYKDVKNVYTIVLFEKSEKRYHEFSDEIYIHHIEARSDTGLEVNMLQRYTYICLDIFRNVIQNKDRKIKNNLEKWLIFLSEDNPEMILRLVNEAPEFKNLYEEVYNICQNVERMMEMFSKELEILDRNTVRYMIDEMQDELDGKSRELAAVNEELAAKNNELDAKTSELDAKTSELDAKTSELDAKTSELNAKNKTIDEQNKVIGERTKRMEEMDQLLKEREEEIQKLTEQLEKLSK